MENISISQTITVLVGIVALIGSVIGLMAWFIRLEAKTSNNKEAIDRLNTETTDLWKSFESHQLNADVHFSERVSKQVDEKHSQRFLRLETELHEIKGLVMRLLERKSDLK